VNIQNATCTNPYGKEITWDSKVGVRYLIFVTGVDSLDSGTFGLLIVDKKVIPNKECLRAATLPYANTASSPATIGSTVNASKHRWCGGPEEWPGIYYQFRGTGKEIRIPSACL
jgi:hypothetical protein